MNPFLHAYRRWLHAVMRSFFKHLYTTLAHGYDLVAWLSSMGQWRSWQRTILPALPQGRLLELGYGTGHLLDRLLANGREVFGLDPSPQMARITRRRLQQHTPSAPLVRGQAQSLPFPSESFGGVFATFPSEYITDCASIREAWRVLRPGGRMVILPGVKEIGGAFALLSPIGLLDRLAAWLYHITGQLYASPSPRRNPLQEALEQTGFELHEASVQLERATVVRIIAIKPARLGRAD